VTTISEWKPRLSAQRRVSIALPMLTHSLATAAILLLSGVVKLYDAMCMHCGTELDFPEVAIEPESVARARGA